MSITVRDCLQTSALNSATVVAGEAGLNKIVTSVSVLEYADCTAMTDEFFLGNELVISALTSVKDNIEEQCKVLIRLHEAGEVGLILYYVGIFLKDIDQSLIDLANELGFPIICMPRGIMNFRYSEALREIFSLIYYDEKQSEDFVSDAVDIIAQLSDRQRNLQSVLRVLSDRLRCTFAVFDSTFSSCVMATWPMWQNFDPSNMIALYEKHNKELQIEKNIYIDVEGKEICVNFRKIKHRTHPDMYLMAISSTCMPSNESLENVTKVIQTSTSFFNIGFGNDSKEDLVLSIIDDNPIEMRKIASRLGFDIASIHTMWVLTGNCLNNEELNQYEASLKVFLKRNNKKVLVDIINDSVVAFMDDAPYIELDAGLAETFMDYSRNEGNEIKLIVCNNLSNTKDVRKAYLEVEKFWRTASEISNKKEILTLREIEFAKECENEISLGLTNVEKILCPLNVFKSIEEGEDLINTLLVLLLDAGGSSKEASELLFVHKNTVNYRINKIKRKLGYDFTKMPEAYALYRAAAIYRILK